MMQIDELVDVSLNCEQRVSMGGSSSFGFGNPMRYKVRAVKMCLSDGAVRGGDEGEDGKYALPLVAVETSPIPDISINTPAGSKVIVHGTVVVSCGVMLLDEGNVFVLGGGVERLKVMQKMAVERSRRRYGVGVGGGAGGIEGGGGGGGCRNDTIRALVWNNDDDDDDDDDRLDNGNNNDDDDRKFR